MITPTLRGSSRGYLLLEALGAVVVLGAAAPVTAYITISGPATYRDTLDGTRVTLTIPNSRPRWFGTVSASPSNYTALGAPACLTVSSASRNFPGDRKQAYLTLSSSETFSSNWNLSIYVNPQAIIEETGNATTSNTLLAQAQNHPRQLVVDPMSLALTEEHTTTGSGTYAVKFPGAQREPDGERGERRHDRGDDRAGVADVQRDDVEHGVDGDGDRGG